MAHIDTTVPRPVCNLEVSQSVCQAVMIMSASEAPESRRTVSNSLWYFETLLAVHSYPAPVAHRGILLELRHTASFFIFSTILQISVIR
jgi:hypothetical protein